MKTIMQCLVLLIPLIAFADQDTHQRDQEKSSTDIENQKQLQEQKEKDDNSVDHRGFDPCLLNPNLPVCTKK